MNFNDFSRLASDVYEGEIVEGECNFPLVVKTKEVEVEFAEDDDSTEVEEDLTEALALLGESLTHLREFLKGDVRRKQPTLKYKEIQALVSDIDIFLDQWEWEGEGGSLENIDRGVIDV